MTSGFNTTSHQPTESAALPASYTTPEEELQALLATGGIVDRSDSSRFLLKGKDALDLLHRISTNDLLSLKQDHCKPTCLTTEKGRILDYIQILRLSDHLHVVASLGMEKTLAAWIEKFTIMEDVRSEGVTDSTAMLSVAGEKAIAAVTSTLKFDPSLNAGAVSHSEFQSVVFISKEGIAPVLNMIIPAEQKSASWNFLLSALAKHEVLPIGRVAYELWRINAGVAAIGHELSGEFNPYEAGLRHAISFTKGCYIGQEVIARLDTYDKVQKTLVGVRLPAGFHSGVPAPILREKDTVGTLTSVAPTDFHGIVPGLAIVRKDAVESKELRIEGHDTPLNMSTSFPLFASE